MKNVEALLKEKILALVGDAEVHEIIDWPKSLTGFQLAKGEDKRRQETVNLENVWAWNISVDRDNMDASVGAALNEALMLKHVKKIKHFYIRNIRAYKIEDFGPSTVYHVNLRFVLGFDDNDKH